MGIIAENIITKYICPETKQLPIFVITTTYWTDRVVDGQRDNVYDILCSCCVHLTKIALPDNSIQWLRRILRRTVAEASVLSFGEIK